MYINLLMNTRDNSIQLHDVKTGPGYPEPTGP
jgi:hypothetical protein